MSGIAQNRAGVTMGVCTGLQRAMQRSAEAWAVIVSNAEAHWACRKNMIRRIVAHDLKIKHSEMWAFMIPVIVRRHHSLHLDIPVGRRYVDVAC